MSALPQGSWKEEYKQLCDNLRDAYLNELYYLSTSASASRRSRFIEFVVAAFAAGSAISGWELWQQPGGKTIWAVLAGAASVLSLAKPFLGFAARAELASGLVGSYRGIRLEFLSVLDDLRVAQEISTSDRLKRHSILERANQLEAKDTQKQDPKLVRKCVAEVNRKYSPDNLQVPEFKLNKEPSHG